MTHLESCGIYVEFLASYTNFLYELIFYKLLCYENMIILCLKKVSSEVESSDSVDLQVTWRVVRSKLPEFPGLQQSSIKLNLCISFFVSTLLSVSVDQDVWIELFHSSWPFTCM